MAQRRLPPPPRQFKLSLSVFSSCCRAAWNRLGVAPLCLIRSSRCPWPRGLNSPFHDALVAIVTSYESVVARAKASLA